MSWSVVTATTCWWNQVSFWPWGYLQHQCLTRPANVAIFSSNSMATAAPGDWPSLQGSALHQVFSTWMGKVTPLLLLHQTLHLLLLSSYWRCHQMGAVSVTGTKEHWKRVLVCDNWSPPDCRSAQGWALRVCPGKHPPRLASQPPPLPPKSQTSLRTSLFHSDVQSVPRRDSACCICDWPPARSHSRAIHQGESH